MIREYLLKESILKETSDKDTNIYNLITTRTVAEHFDFKIKLHHSIYKMEKVIKL